MKPKTVYLVDKPVAAGLGLGINVKEAQGVLIVDIGAETTEISVLSLGGIVISRLIQTGGRSIDDAIQSAIRKEHNFFIGSQDCRVDQKRTGLCHQSGRGNDEDLWPQHGSGASANAGNQRRFCIFMPSKNSLASL